jgi:hypothetical protein
MASTVGICINLLECASTWPALTVFGGGQNQFSPFLLWENETEFINGEKIHQQLECGINWRTVKSH